MVGLRDKEGGGMCEGACWNYHGHGLGKSVGVGVVVGGWEEGGGGGAEKPSRDRNLRPFNAMPRGDEGSWSDTKRARGWSRARLRRWRTSGHARRARGGEGRVGRQKLGPWM